MRKTNLIVLGIVYAMCVSGCSWFHKSQAVAEPRPEAAKISKKEAIDTAKEFAAKEGLGDEFRIDSPAKVGRYLTLGQDSHWVWRVYFAHNSQRMVKFYKKSPVMVQINALTGEVENWGRR